MRMEASTDTHDCLQFLTEQGWIEVEEKNNIYIYDG